MRNLRSHAVTTDRHDYRVQVIHTDLADQTCGFLYLKVPNDFRGLSEEVRPRTRSEVPREQNELLVRREENEVEEQDGQADGQV